MTKTLFVLLCLALWGMCVQGGSYYSLCPKEGSKCTAQASLRLSAGSGGYSSYRGRYASYRGGHSSSSYCTSSASALCTTARQSSSCSQIVTSYKQEKCGHYDVVREAECWARSFALAYTSAHGEIKCRGSHTSTGCFRVKAEGVATACSVAQVLVDIMVSAGVYTAQCDAQVAAAIEAVATAVSRSNAGGCVSNGVFAAGEYQFVAEVKEVLAKAFAACWIYCDYKGTAASQVSGGAVAEVTKEQKADVGASYSTGYNYPELPPKIPSPWKRPPPSKRPHSNKRPSKYRNRW